MRFKLDENIGRRGIELLCDAGHDAVTVRDEGLAGAPDEEVFAAAASERRALVTLDYDFAHTLRFPPEAGAGVAVLELGGTGFLARVARSDPRIARPFEGPLPSRAVVDH